MLKVVVSYSMALLWLLFAETNITILPKSFFADKNNICYGLNLQCVMTVLKPLGLLQRLHLLVQQKINTLYCTLLLAEIRW